MSRIATILVAAALAAPAAASADPRPDSTATASTANGARAPRYCVVDEATTGTHLEKRTCKSLEAWLAEGYDPRVKTRK